MHAHAGFLARGQVQIGYADGCTVDFTAPQVVAIEPRHDGLVVGNEPAMMIELDLNETIQRLDMPDVHRHRSA